MNFSSDHFLPELIAVHKISLKTDLAKDIAFGVKVFEWKYLEILQLLSPSRVYSDDWLSHRSLRVLDPFSDRDWCQVHEEVLR